MKELEVLKSLLGSNFRYYVYDEAIIRVREDIKKSDFYKSKLNDLIKLILYRKLSKGEALSLIHNDANLVIFENTDEEAYRWLDLFLVNIVSEREIIPYEDIQSINH
ncbi:MAG: hypothetical protein ACO1N0_02090 [Fluviicola sp.]